MATAFSHPAVPIAIALAVGTQRVPLKLAVLASVFSALPDLDSIGHKFGIEYSSEWGHRGFTHSVFFAFVCALLFMNLHQWLKTSRIITFIMLFVSMASHGIVDAFTNGGLGIAFFWPFSDERYFFAYQVIEVAPLSIVRFFTQRGLDILKSEVYYLWLPCLLSALLLRLFLSRRSLRS